MWGDTEQDEGLIDASDKNMVTVVVGPEVELDPDEGVEPEVYDAD